MTLKSDPGNFFEDFRIGQTIRHATPRTVTLGDVALYNGLYGPRFALQSSDAFAQAIGQAIPLTHFLRIIRGIVLRGATLADLLPELAKDMRPPYRDVTYFYGIDFHQDIIDFKL